jgi:hypothetical protein
LFADTGLKEDRYIKAIQIKTDSVAGYRSRSPRPSIHGGRQSVRQPSWTTSNGDVSLNEYSIGKKGDIFPDDSGRLIKAGGKVRFNVHMHPSGEETKLRVGVDGVLSEGRRSKHAVVTDAMGGSQNLDIPSGEVVRTDGYTAFKTPVKITGFQPHMHYRGKGGCIEALYPNGQTEVLNCAGFNLGWGIMYNYADDSAPILPAGSFLHVINWHDNTASNRGNPDSKNWTGSGDRTVDEMSHSWVSWYPMTEESPTGSGCTDRAQDSDEPELAPRGWRRNRCPYWLLRHCLVCGACARRRAPATDHEQHVRVNVSRHRGCEFDCLWGDRRHPCHRRAGAPF